ncbi:MAG: LysR family transcriptional regulator [Sutterellaceae bacterium]|nr:LysR family transcriptional regulator [Sutterellaceae bacterium]MDY2867894.1 LysR family transcriptional regulator [Mesosutterella sp.]
MANSKKTGVDYIRAIAASGSFLAASEALHVTQPAISQYIGKIERENGIQLFNRNVRPVTLTSEGRYYLKVEEEIEELRRRRRRYFEDLGGEAAGELRIGTNQCRTSTVLSEVLGDYAKRCPGVTLKIIECGMREMDRRMLAGELDFTITLEALLTPQMAYRTLLDENILIAFPPGDPMGERARKHKEEGGKGYLPFSFQEAENSQFILLNRGLKFHDYFDRLCEKYRVKPRVLMQTDSVTTVLELVTKGVGCGMVPDSLVHYRKPEPEPALYSLQHEFPTNRVVAAWNRDLYLTRAARIFIEMLAEKHRPLNTDPETGPKNERPA